MARLYIAGPMTGYPAFNFPAFYEAAKTLRAQGLEIISPAEEDEKYGVAQVAISSTDGKLDANGKIAGSTWGDMLARDVKIVADLVDGVAVLKNWERSKGAKLEVTVAILTGKAIFAYHEGSGLTELSREWVKEVLHANL
jgi:Domain of unknown function (DUF4406)